jgi:hypothetical protein
MSSLEQRISKPFKDGLILPERIRQEWSNECGYYSSKTDSERFDEFKKVWNVESETVQEILKVSDTVNREWKYYRMRKGYHHEIKNLEKAWDDFKKFFDIELDRSQKMFQEMELLSDGLLREWRYKYNFDFPHVYEENYWTNHLDTNKPKWQMWEEFKEIWELDPENYNENEYKKMFFNIININFLSIFVSFLVVYFINDRTK